MEDFRAKDRGFDLEDTLDLLERVEYDSLFSFKYSRRPNTAALLLDDQVSEDEKSRRLIVIQEAQRKIQTRRNAQYVGNREECLVEGFNKATGQWIGRTSQNKTLNFLWPAAPEGVLGKYVEVQVTRAGPYSLAGEAAKGARVPA